VTTPVDEVNIDQILIPSGMVQAGDVIMKLNDEELLARLYSLKAEKSQEEVRAGQALANPIERRLHELELDRLQNEIIYIEAQIAKCLVKSPITGMIMTADLDLMEGLPVKKGDALFEVADLSEWEVILDVLQEEVGWVQRVLDQEVDNPQGLAVEFFLEAYPEQKLQAKVTELDQIAQMARVKEEGNVFEIRVNVPQEELLPIQEQLRDLSVGRAKIDTVTRPLAYVLLRKVIRFFRVAFF